MAEQRKYQPLLEKILESLEADKITRQPSSQSAKFGLEVPTFQNETVADPRFVQHIPSGKPVDETLPAQEQIDIANQTNTLSQTEPAPVFQDSLNQPLPDTIQAPPDAPLSRPLSRSLSGQSVENYYEETHLNEPVSQEPILEETSSQKEQPMDPHDQIPALFHRDELRAENAHKIPITKALYGLTGAIFVGAASVFYILPDPRGDRHNVDKNTVAQSANKLFPDNLNSNFAGGNLASDNQNTLSVGVSDESWEKGPTGNPVGNLDQGSLGAKESPQPKMFASINGPIDQLVSKVVKDLSTSESKKQETFGHKDVVNFDQTQGPAETLNQLENSLENIANDASSQLSPPAKKILLAQNTSNPASNSAPTNKVNNDKMRALTDQVVDALSDLNAAENSNGSSLNQSVDHLRTSLSNLVEEAENQGKGVKRVQHLLEEALGNNKQNLPAALKNKDGSLDISTLIASVVKRSDGKTNTPGADAEYLALIEDEGEKTALTSRILTQKGKGRFLIVKAGDTLSSIAYATYGDAFAYPRIFNANKGVITNANNLKIGMRLTIPK